MEQIKLLSILKNKTSITYNFSYSEGLSCFFTDHKFIIHYPFDVSNIPDSILAIPFISNVIHLIWITNSCLSIDSLDEDFYNCLPKLKAAFSAMFPETNFSGQLLVKRIESNIPLKHGKSGMFYSGGVDSMQTLISHLNEKVDLISIWGSDIEYDNEKGWNVLFDTIKKSTYPFNLNLYVIHSSFRTINNGKILHQKFSEQLKDSWWHGLQHGIGLLGHVAPLAYAFGYDCFYIASTHSNHDTDIRCSSHPTTDNCVKFCGCRVIHDGFEYRRQNKIKNIIEFSNKNPKLPIQLHVCWKTQNGNNCCACEKCARTIYAIVIEGGDPSVFGFCKIEGIFSLFGKKNCLMYLFKHPHLYHAWFDIADRAREQKKTLKKHKLWKRIKWITYTLDRSNPKTWEFHPNLIKIFARKILNRIIKIKKNICFSFYLGSKKRDGLVYLLGTPTHCNIGDAAIAQAEIDFIKSLKMDPIEITVNDWKKYKKTVIKKIKNKVILLHGGGNFGNLWPYEESIREDIIKSIKSPRFILMPQTFFLTNDVSKEYIELLKNLYNSNRFSLFAREKYSYSEMLKLFPLAKVHLVPDIVLFEKNSFASITVNQQKTTDVLLVLRNDKEALLHFDDKKRIKEIIEKNNLSYNETDMLNTSGSINQDIRMDIISEKLKQFASAKLIITDRLHGMIFAYLSNVPCIVLHNNNYKIDGIYEYLKDISQTILLDKYDDLSLFIKKDFSQNKNNNNTNEMFDILKKEIVMEQGNANS